LRTTTKDDIVLSKRMQTLVDFVSGDSIADIGCDHAFVSLKLMMTGKAKRVIAMDVRTGPLEIARQNITRYGYQDEISVRLSDGFEKLEAGEADCAVIAGMGGLLMVRILKDGKLHTDKGIALVLQPQSEIDELRKYLQEIHYDVVEEEMLLDEGKYYTVMKATKAEGDIIPYTDTEFLYGRCLIRNKHKVLQDYLTEQIRKQEALLASLQDVNTDSARLRMESLKLELQVAKTCLLDMRE